VLRHLKYKPWFAMASSHNSLQSYFLHRDALQRLHGAEFRLRVEIELDRSDEMRIKVRDNAAGIASSEYARAFRAAELPPETTGLAEFGMGMKSAACWFAPRWRARTSALGEPVERTISFDIATIVRDDIQELEVIESPAVADSHFTEITLLDPYNKLQTRTGAKIKEHLASIYRIFLRQGVLELRFDGEELKHETAPVLVQPYFKTPNEPAKRWQGLRSGSRTWPSCARVCSAPGSCRALRRRVRAFRRNRLDRGKLGRALPARRHLRQWQLAP
jgi:hypothetical protein